MIRWVGAMLLLNMIVAGLYQVAVSARPQYLAQYQADPFRRVEVDGCATCHVNPAGGGARNDFGGAFEAAAHEISPMLRSGFPQQFKFETAKLPDGSTFHFSDPASKFVVFERQKQKVLVDLAAVSAPKTVLVPAAENRMSFFVSSTGFSKAGGLAGADHFCQNLAKAAGAADRTWRAYLSTSFQDKPAVNAGDRIGSGPWYNAKGALVARGPVELHTKDRLRPELVLDEKGNAAPHLDVLTGTLPNGTAAVGNTCGNWTGPGIGEATVGTLLGSWNSERTTTCGAGVAPDAASKSLYCFAVR